MTSVIVDSATARVDSFIPIYALQAYLFLPIYFVFPTQTLYGFDVFELLLSKFIACFCYLLNAGREAANFTILIYVKRTFFKSLLSVVDSCPWVWHIQKQSISFVGDSF